MKLKYLIFFFAISIAAITVYYIYTLKTKVVGHWMIVDLKQRKLPKDCLKYDSLLHAEPNGYFMNLYADGTYSDYLSGKMVDTGKYEYSRTEIAIHLDHDKSPLTLYVESIDAHTLILKWGEGASSCFTYIK